MRAIIDTNVLLAGLLWHGMPHKLIEHVRNGTLTLISSPALLAELAEVFCAAEVRCDPHPVEHLARTLAR